MSTEPPSRGRVTYVLDARQVGGAERYVRLLADALSDRVDACAVAVEPVPAALAGALGPMPVHSAPAVRHKADLRALAALRRALVVTRPDLVHVNLSATTGNRHGVVAGLALRVPVVVTLHLASAPPTSAQAALLRPVYRRVAAGIGVSRETATTLEVLGVRASRVHRIWNGVPLARLRRRDPGEPVRIGAVGRLTDQKGFDLLIRAARDLVHPGGIEVLIAGDGPARDRLVALGGGARLRMLGHQADVDRFLAGLDVFCLPSRWEGLPFALLEAMMLGLPCVTTDVGDVAEAAGPTALVVPPGDVAALRTALQGLVSDPHRRAALGDAAHRRAVESLSVDAMAAATARVYAEAVAGRRRRR